MCSSDLTSRPNHTMCNCEKPTTRSTMSTMLRALITMLLLTSPLLLQAAPDVGDEAPGFALSASDGRQYSLSDFRDQKGVVIAFFPKAFTGG